VTEGKTFPDGSLIIGSPARAIRQLDGQAIATLQQSAAHYARRARAYAEGLVRIE
jgi:carbonic anhydrase/acetyltransferase-like protein (isoleucine patch superfamily)